MRWFTPRGLVLIACGVVSGAVGAQGASSVPTSLAPSVLVEQIGPPGPFIAAGGVPVAGPLQLREAVRLAVNRHPSIADAIATLAQQQGGIDVARAGYYPQVRVGVNTGSSSGRGNLNVGDDTVMLATASASQRLYDFGKVDSQVGQAQALVRRQQAVILRQIDAVAKDSADAVVMAHRYQSLVVIAQDYVTAVERVLEMAQLRAGAGVSTKADPIQAVSRLDAARAALLQTRTLQRQWNERLHTLIGSLPAAQGIAPLPEALAQEVRLNEQPDYRALPEVLIAEAERQTAGAQLSLARAQRWPTISLDASINKALRGANPTTLESHGSYQTLMVNVSAPIYQGGALDAQVRSAVAAEQAARMRIENARLNVDDLVRNYREQLTGARERLSVLSDRKRSIVEARDLYQEQYKLGTRSILDLLNAEQEIYQASAEEEGVRHDLWQSLVSYVNAVGQSRAFYALNNTTIQGMDVLP